MFGESILVCKMVLEQLIFRTVTSYAYIRQPLLLYFRFIVG